MISKHTTRNRAFTLIEIAVVLVIIALIGGIGLSASRDMLDSANYVATQNRLDTIEKALYTFWQKNGRLPCPADATLASSNANYGVEAVGVATSYNCTGGSPAANFASATNVYKATEGAVPVVTLGLPKDFIFDGWKRKIAYAVKPEFVQPYSRTRILPKNSVCVANTAIRVKDASGADRSTSAVYALVSFGKNGHGAYPATGSTRYNAGSTNADEQTNCHCSSSAANATYDGNYVQRNQNLNSTTAANYFDDIVRYKERWQLATAEDALNDDGYRGPDLAIGYIKAATGTAYVYKNQCGAYVKQADLSPLPTDQVRGIAFTSGNKHLLVYSALGCNLYKVNANGTLTNLPSAFATACPYNATAVMELSNNGYLAISTSTASAVIHLWKQSGDKFIALSDLTHSSATVTGLSFSPDAKLLAVRSSAASSSKIYKRKGDSFSSAAADITQPTGIFTYNTSPSQVIFSPDGKYLFSLEQWVAKGAGMLNLWRVLGGNIPSFAALQSFAPYIGSSTQNFTFAQNSNMLHYFVFSMGINYSYKCRLTANDNFCGTKFWHVDGYYYTSPSSIQEMVDDMGQATYAFSRNNELAIARSVVNNVPEILRPTTGGIGAVIKIFQSDGTTGATPVRAVDQVLAGSSGGPVAFAH